MHQQDNITIFRTFPGGLNHSPVKPSLGAEDARRVNEDDLRLLLHGDAAHTAARRLHFRGHDRYLAADHGIHQCRLAGIGCADQRYKAGLCLHVPKVCVSHM
ncbi:MAG: Uncharacterised protein [SAR116 cluster bacterium]|nr:MAG: Uncharacterised protein [SAR116 cluster bacterium]